jgi:hypothetical protein
MSDFGSQPPDYGSQPPGAGGMPPAPGPSGMPPNNYLVWAILTTILCCLPLGVVSIVFAAQVNSKWAAGDYAGARDSAEKAKRFAIWSAIAGVVVTVVAVVLSLVFGFALESGSRPGY